MNTPTPLPTPTAPKTLVFAHHAAKASWSSVVIILVLAAFSGAAQRQFVDARVLIELIALFLMVVGLALGVIALFGIRKHGTRGILAPAIVGIILNGLLLFIFVTNFLAARARAREHTRGAQSRAVEAKGRAVYYC